MEQTATGTRKGRKPKRQEFETAASDRITIRLLSTERRRKLIALRKAEDDLPDEAEMIRRLMDRAAS